MLWPPRSTTVLLVASIALTAKLPGCGRGMEGPQPMAAGADPQVICSEQMETAITVTGDGFSPAPLDALTSSPELALPKVTLIRTGDIDGSESLDGEAWVLNEEVTDSSGDRIRWISQEELSLRIDEELGLERGVYDVFVLNPTGGEHTLARAFAAVPAPELDSIEPLPVCTAQHSNTLVLSGSWFLTIGDDVPTVTIGDRSYASAPADCEILDTPRADEVRRCATLTVEVGVDELAPGAHEVLVTNPSPAHCRTTEAITFHVVPPPSVESVTDQPVCLAEDVRPLAVAGSGFLQIDGDLPRVRIGDHDVHLVSMEGCEPIAGLTGVTSCTRIDVALEPDVLPAGRHAVVVTNPAPAHCYSEEPSTLTVVSPPVVLDVSPQPVCGAQGTTSLSLQGSDFLEVRGEAPTVYAGEVTAAEVSVVDDSCVHLDDSSLETRVCLELVAVFDEAALEPGLAPVRVENPSPAGCSSTDDVSISVVPPPALLAVQPNPICVAQGAVAITLIGTGFLEIDGVVGSIVLESTLAGGVVVPSEASAVAESCEEVPGVDNALSCTHITALVEKQSLSEGDSYSVSITNPEPAACVSTEEVLLEVVPPPVLHAESIRPSAVCSGGAVFVVEGENLFGVNAYLQNDDEIVWAANVDVDEAGTEATLFFNSLQPGEYRLHLTGAAGCGDATDEAVIAVETGPTIFFVDPPVVYNGTAMRVSLYITRLSAAPHEVAMIASGGDGDASEIPLLDVSWDEDKPNIVQATIPLPAEGRIAPGSYDVIVRGLEGCDAFMEEGLELVEETTIALTDTSITPGFGEAGQPVPVSVHAAGEQERASGEVGFEATPRVYVSSSQLATAEPLRAVTHESDALLTAVVPGLPEGAYDLIVVNPDGGVGFVPAAYRVTEVSPPLVEDVFPTQVEDGAVTPMTIVGENFFFDPSADELGLAVVATCRDTHGAAHEVELTVNVGESDSTEWRVLSATLPAGPPHGSACVVRVENTINDTFDEWSALTVTNPASRLPAFAATSEMVEPRRAPAMAVGRATREARFVYAIGGDEGSPASAKSTVEASSVGRFGELGSWRVLQTGLVGRDGEETTRTLASGHRDGRFLYLIGGMTGDEEVVPDVLRAQVLDPLPPSVPDIFDVDIDFAGELDTPDLDGSPGLGVGAWTYLVSAVMADTDPENPGGETLPSEARTLYLPDVPGGMKVTLSWHSVVGPAGDHTKAYYVYRTPVADAPISEMHLVAIIDGTSAATHSYTDDEPDPLGQEGADPSKVPLRLGALGSWHHVGDIGRPRAAFGLAAATDPNPADPAAPGQYWYAIGGISMEEDGEGAPVLIGDTSTYDVAHFEPDSATLGSFTTETTNLDSRREHGVWVATADNTEFITAPNETWIYVGLGHYGGFTAPGNRTRVHYAKVLPDGRLGQPAVGGGTDSPGSFSSANPATTSRGGMATLIGSNFLYILGGLSGNTAVDTASFAEIRSGSPGLVTTISQSAAADLHEARYLPGFARRGAFLYLAGGANAAGEALSSTEMNVR